MPDAHERELRITDPRALRALAHPARQRLITELFSGEVLTATEAAELCGLTPSAMSYHLRALERWGLVERDESADGRERPWRATADTLTLTPEAHRGAGAATSRTAVHSWFSELGEDLDRAAEAVATGGDRGTTSRERLWLTVAEERELHGRLHALLGEYHGRTSRRHPEGARPWNVYTLVLPAEPRRPRG